MRRMIIILTVLLFTIPVFAQGPPVHSRTNRPPSWNHRPPSWSRPPVVWHPRPPSWGWHHRPPSWGWVRPVPHFGMSLGFSSSSFSSSSTVFVQAPPVQTVFVQAPAVVPVQTIVVSEPVRDQMVVVKIGDTVVSRLKPGEAVITPDGLILENVDGRLVVHRGQ